MPNSGSNKNKASKSKSNKSKASIKQSTNLSENKFSTTSSSSDKKTIKEVESSDVNNDKNQSSIKVDSIGPNRFQVLSYDQVKYLHRIIERANHLCPISDSCYPPVSVSIKSIIGEIRKQLKAVEILVKDVRLSGNAASHVLDLDSRPSESSIDIEIIFTVNIHDNSTFQRIKSSVFMVFIDLINKRLSAAHPQTTSATTTATTTPTNTPTPTTATATTTTTTTNTKDTIQTPLEISGPPPPITYDVFNQNYIQKLARVVRHQDVLADCWSVISVGLPQDNQRRSSTTITMKFIDRMKRPYEFSVDSFQIVLDTILNFYTVTKSSSITQNLFPTVVVESVSGSFQEAYRHLKEHIIFTKNPEEICGGGLLKYCHLLTLGYKQDPLLNTKITEKYMCSRFFIDYPDINSQQGVILSYLDKVCHNDQEAKTRYLTILYRVVSHSTVCLMTHERRQTFHLIQSLLYSIIHDIEIKKSSVQLDDMGTQSWVLDQVFFGTFYFPKQFYLTTPLDNDSLIDPNNFCDSNSQIFICTGNNDATTTSAATANNSNNNNNANNSTITPLMCA